MSKKIFVICISLIVLGCFFSCKKQPQSELYMRDKEHIEKAYVSNIEAMRRVLLNQKDGYWLFSEYEGLPDSIKKYEGFTYTDYWDAERKALFAMPVPACKYLDVEVGSISYSPDSLKCVALLSVYDKGDLYTPRKKKELDYDGHALIGIRDSKDEQFKIYPYQYTSFHGYPSKMAVNFLLKRIYYNLKDNYAPESHVQYTCGINNPEFFETAHEFSRIDSLDLYWCETVMIPGGSRRPYLIYSNQDSTITKYLCGDSETEDSSD